MKVVFFLNKLHESVKARDYERWVREVDCPTARTIPSIVDYRVARIEGLLEGDEEPPYQYIERVEITDLDSYRRDLADPALDDFKHAWLARVAESIALQGTVIE
jgi:REDY-like protein HapK